MLVNDQIKASNVQLIAKDGENLGLVSRDKALQMAIDAQLDLVQMSDKGKQDAPVAKIMDFGKVLYDKKKKLTESKKRQKIVQVKEIKLRPKIGIHDYNTKMKRGVEFLKKGKYLKITLMFRGREMATRAARGAEMFTQIDDTFREYDILNKLVIEKESKMGQFWSKIYYLKDK